MVGLSAGGHEGGEDVVRVAVQVLAGSVVPHRGAQVGVTGSGTRTILAPFPRTRSIG